MLEQGVKLPEIYIDAKNLIEGVLSESSKLSLRSYRGTYSMFSNLCDIVHYHIEEVEDEESYANLDMTLTYKVRVMTPENKFDVIEKVRNLRVLSTLGDNLWTYRMINKVWEGDYPSTVAVDMETGEVFFFSIKLNRLELIEFGKFTETEFETFRYELNDREPFSIKIDEKAMFDYIDEAEGVKHLQRNIVVEFNCGLPIKVKENKEEIKLVI